jgi:hypothetical protein
MQAAILRELAQGRNARQAAHNLDITHDTAKSHLSMLYKRIGVGGAPHAVSRVHDAWPELLADLTAPITERPYLGPQRREMWAMLWDVAQGAQIRGSGHPYGLSRAASASRARVIFRALQARSAAQAVHHAYCVGAFPPEGEIRWAPTL